MDLLSKIEDLTKQLELEKEAHKKTMSSYAIKTNAMVKHHNFIFNQNQDLKRLFKKVDVFTKQMLSDGRITNEELSEFFTKKEIE